MKGKAAPFLLAFGVALLGAAPVAAQSMAATVRLNVRSAPGFDSVVRTVLFKGERVMVHTCQNDWCLVTHNGPDGWVYKPYLADGSFHKSWSATSAPYPATIGNDAGNVSIGATVDLPAARPHKRSWR